MSIPIMIVVYALHKTYKATRRDAKRILVPLSEIDLDSGRRIQDIELFKHELEEDKARIAAKPLYYRIYRFWC